MDYVNKFNHLSQYAGIHVDTDEKKKDRFYHGLLHPLGETVHWELSDLRGNDECCHRPRGLTARFPGRVEEEAVGYGVF